MAAPMTVTVRVRVKSARGARQWLRLAERRVMKWLIDASVKSQRGKCDRPSIGPRAPRGKAARKAAAWRKFYADMAAWYDEKHQFFSKHDGSPFATFHCAGERDRFLEGVRLIDAGQHPNQIAGVWR